MSRVWEGVKEGLYRQRPALLHTVPPVQLLHGNQAQRVAADPTPPTLAVQGIRTMST